MEQTHKRTNNTKRTIHSSTVTTTSTTTITTNASNNNNNNNNNVQTLRHEKIETLLKDARSHGPYLWTRTDIRHALLWFQKSNDDDDSSKDRFALSRRKLLRSLLSSRGVLEYRHRNTTNKKRSKKQLEQNDLHSKANASNHTNKMNPRLLLREEVHRRNKQKRVFVTCWKELLRGYYNHEDKFDSNRTNNEVEEKGVLLRRDLHQISTSRLVTRSLYQLCHVIAAATSTAITKIGEEEAPSLSFIKMDNTDSILLAKTTQMMKHSDVYFTHPDTAVHRTYAIQLYDRLLLLMDYSNSDDNDDDQSNNNTKAIEFLHKLRLLSRRDERIKSVLLWMSLEPLRRLKPNHNDDDGVVDSQQAKHTNTNANPRLTFINHTIHTIDNACATPACILICLSILSSEDNNNITNQKDNVLIGGNHNNCMWCLPSPLLTIVSQCYFNIAEEYINHWIHVCITSHIAIPSAMAAQVSRCSTNTTSSSSPPPLVPLVVKDCGCDTKKQKYHHGSSSNRNHNNNHHHPEDILEEALSRLEMLAVSSDRLTIFLKDRLESIVSLLSSSDDVGGAKHINHTNNTNSVHDEDDDDDIAKNNKWGDEENKQQRLEALCVILQRLFG